MLYELARLEWRSVRLFQLNASSQKFTVFSVTSLYEVSISTQSIHVKFIRYNLKVSQPHNICDLSHTQHFVLNV